ncbi:MAG: acyl-CoA dehydratase activase [Candidatus Margulisiibacteriota bacterium]
MECYFGIDVGSVSTNFVLIGPEGKVIKKLYLRTHADPIKAIKTGFLDFNGETLDGCDIKGVGATGSGRQLAAIMVGADLIKNEITAHAVAAIHSCPQVRTVLEIGGQDSKIILIQNGVAVDFGMNTICAAGTGSFLEQQSNRINISIEDFGDYALRSLSPSAIAGRCTVFAETDMIHKQQQGHAVEDIIAGLCHSLVRNYLNTVAKGKKIEEPILFQGGVAANKGIVDAFKKILGKEIIVPEYFDSMGALGAALLAKDKMHKSSSASKFKGPEKIINSEFKVVSDICKDCGESCEIERYTENGIEVAVRGGRCGKWDNQ